MRKVIVVLFLLLISVYASADRSTGPVYSFPTYGLKFQLSYNWQQIDKGGSSNLTRFERRNSTKETETTITIQMLPVTKKLSQKIFTENISKILGDNPRKRQTHIDHCEAVWFTTRTEGKKLRFMEVIVCEHEDQLIVIYFKSRGKKYPKTIKELLASWKWLKPESPIKYLKIENKYLTIADTFKMDVVSILESYSDNHLPQNTMLMGIYYPQEKQLSFMMYFTVVSPNKPSSPIIRTLDKLIKDVKNKFKIKAARWHEVNGCQNLYTTDLLLSREYNAYIRWVYYEIPEKLGLLITCKINTDKKSDAVKYNKAATKMVKTLKPKNKKS